MFGARLRSEELYEVRGWWNERRNSLPWAQRYVQGSHSEDADYRTDQSAQIGADEKLGGWRDWWHEWRLGTGRYAAASVSQAPPSDPPQHNRIDERALRRLRRYHRQSFAATYFIVALPYVMALLTFIAAGWAVARSSSRGVRLRPARDSHSTPPTPMAMPSHANGEIRSPSRASASTAELMTTSGSSTLR